MGKTLETIAGVVAIVAIAAVAPWLAGTVFGLTGLMASIATAAIIAAGSFAVSLGFRALGVGSVPSARAATSEPQQLTIGELQIAPGFGASVAPGFTASAATVPTKARRTARAVSGIAPQGTAVVGVLGWTTGVFGTPAPYGLEPTMRPILKGPWLRRAWWRFYGRFHIIQFVGDCLSPRVSDHFAIIDLDAEIRAGDVVSCDILDVDRAFPGDDVTGMAKRFVGINHEAAVIELQCTKPAYTIHTGVSNVTRASRVRATAATFNDAQVLLRKVRRDPAAYDKRLMADA